MTLRRILTAIAGLAPMFFSYQDQLPPWVGMVGGVLFGTAINAERLLAKRAQGAPSFNVDAAREKLR